MPTIFAKIINREIPAHIVYEDDLVIAFLDISQATKGHTLVVSKELSKDIFELKPETASHLFMVTQKLSVAIQKAFNVSGLNILSNNGETAGQSVFHFHIHLIPRYAKGDLSFQLPNNMGSVTFDEYKERAQKIKEALS
jgi:histidine triad (HIT) family protein